MPRHSRQADKPAQSSDDDANTDQGQRLQKVLAAAGLGSRRQCEELIRDSRVEVDGQVVTQLGTRVDRGSQEIRVDGVALQRPRLVHYMLNKPPGIVSTSRDPAGRPRVIDLVPQRERLFTVGRLDLSSEGLIVVTNDGELANRLTHPRYGIEKTYHVEVAGNLSFEELLPLRKGMHLAEGLARPVEVRIRNTHKKSTLLEIVLDEGRNREIRRLLARLGHKVLRLKRVALGPLRLGELPPGHFRELTREEVRDLRHAAPHEPRSRARRAGRRPGRKPTSAGRKPEAVERRALAPPRRSIATTPKPIASPPKPRAAAEDGLGLLIRAGQGAFRQGIVIGGESPTSTQKPPPKTSPRKSPKSPTRKPAKTRRPRGKQKLATGKGRRG